VFSGFLVFLVFLVWRMVWALLGTTVSRLTTLLIARVGEDSVLIVEPGVLVTVERLPTEGADGRVAALAVTLPRAKIPVAVAATTTARLMVLRMMRLFS
jgi:hypothetical protein